MIEFACPESCQYLISAREQAIARERELRARATSLLVPEVELDQQCVPLVSAIDTAIVRTEREQSVEDVEVLEAINNSIRNLETESSGLIYEHRASSPRVNLMSARIRSALEEAARNESRGVHLTRSDMINALKVTRSHITLHVRLSEQDPGNSKRFARNLALFYPWPEEATKPLII